MGEMPGIAIFAEVTQGADFAAVDVGLAPFEPFGTVSDLTHLDIVVGRFHHGNLIMMAGNGVSGMLSPGGVLSMLPMPAPCTGFVRGAENGTIVTRSRWRA